MPGVRWHVRDRPAGADAAAAGGQGAAGGDGAVARRGRGVGTVTGQLARHWGLRPLLGTASSPAKAEFARGYGYGHVFGYTDFAEGVLAATAGRGVDVVLDPVGGQVRARSFELLAPFGRLVTYSNISRESEVVPAAAWMRARCVGYLGFSGGQLPLRDPPGQAVTAGSCRAGLLGRHRRACDRSLPAGTGRAGPPGIRAPRRSGQVHPGGLAPHPASSPLIPAGRTVCQRMTAARFGWLYARVVRGSVTVHIAAPADRVWDLVSDVTRIGEFSPETFEAEWLSGARRPEVGARFRGHVRRNGGPVYWTACTVVVSDPGREFAFTVAGPGGATVNTWRYQLAPSADRH